MRLIKTNNIKYPVFHNSLPVVKRQGAGYSEIERLAGDAATNLSGNQDAGIDYMQRVINFQNEINSTKNELDTSNSFRNEILNSQGYREATIYLFDTIKKSFYPLGENDNHRLTSLINKVHQNGLIDWIFETGQSTLIPEYDQNKKAPSKFSYIVSPILKNNKKFGLVTLLVPASALPGLLTENRYIKICQDIVLNRVEKLELKRDLASAFENLQAYQSKLTNDFKLSAIGELTTGVVEEILSPLQIILGYTDMLMQASDEDSIDSFEKIKYQVKRVENLLSRLIKFANLDDKQIKVQACNINEIVGEFYSVMESSLQRENYECLLDLEQDLPSVLSHPNYIMQLLTHIFSIVKPVNNRGGGIYIQTKYSKESVSIKVITTDYFSDLDDKKSNGIIDTTYKIIQNIMKKHNGDTSLNTSETSGTSIMLIFPLKEDIKR